MARKRVKRDKKKNMVAIRKRKKVRKQAIAQFGVTGPTQWIHDVLYDVNGEEIINNGGPGKSAFQQVERSRSEKRDSRQDRKGRDSLIWW